MAHAKSSCVLSQLKHTHNTHKLRRFLFCVRALVRRVCVCLEMNEIVLLCVVCLRCVCGMYSEFYLVIFKFIATLTERKQLKLLSILRLNRV